MPLRCRTCHCDRLLDKFNIVITTCYPTGARSPAGTRRGRTGQSSPSALTSMTLRRPSFSSHTRRQNARSQSTWYQPHAVEPGTNWRSSQESPRIHINFIECLNCAPSPLPESRWAQVHLCTSHIPSRPEQITNWYSMLKTKPHP